MYESPIELMMKQVEERIVEQRENEVVAAVNQAFGVNVDKAELIKALNYDRNQYEKGYSDGVLAENSRHFKTDCVMQEIRDLITEYKEVVAGAKCTYVRTEASKMWLADGIIELFKDEFKEAEEEIDND